MPVIQRIAGYGQTCAACEKWYPAGELIAADGERGWVHAACVRTAAPSEEAPSRPPPIPEVLRDWHERQLSEARLSEGAHDGI